MYAMEFLESVEDELMCVTEGKLDNNKIHDIMEIIGSVHIKMVVERVIFIPKES
jgi:hypothetical protein